MPPFPSTRSYILNAARRGRLAWRVAVAGALVLTVALCSVLGLHLGYSASFATLFVGVTIAAWTVGSRVAVAFALFGYLACHYLLSDSRYELSFTDARTLAVMVAYALSCGLIIAIGETMRSAQDRAHARGELLRVASPASTTPSSPPTSSRASLTSTSRPRCSPVGAAGKR